jgi:23S rRNA pseudouridine955/2504/2580 synthase
MDKRYFACGHGQWQPDWGRRRVVKAPLFKYSTAEGERRVRVQDDGLPSHTVFNLIERWPDYALVEAELKTGRTHQIRVHLAHLGLPIAGDAKYGDFALNKALARERAAVAQTDVPARVPPEARTSAERRAAAVRCAAAGRVPALFDQLSALRDTA